MKLDLLFLPLLGGYIFFTCFHGTGFRAVSYPAQRLLFPSAMIGLIALVLGRILQTYAGLFDACSVARVMNETASCAGPFSAEVLASVEFAREKWLMNLVGIAVPWISVLLALAASLATADWLFRARTNGDPDNQQHKYSGGISDILDATMPAPSARAGVKIFVSLRRRIELSCNAICLVAAPVCLAGYMFGWNSSLTLDEAAPLVVWISAAAAVSFLIFWLWSISDWPLLALSVRVFAVTLLITLFLATIPARPGVYSVVWQEFLGLELRALVTQNIGTAAAALAFLVAVSAAFVGNLLLTPRAAAAMLHKRQRTTRLEQLAFAAQLERKLVQIDLEDGKVYIGAIIDAPTHAEIATGYLAILPLMSGYRESDTRELKIITEYTGPYARIRTEWAKNKIEQNIRLSEFVKVVPLKSIAAACRFNVDDYLKFELWKPGLVSQNSGNGPPP
jgi:hypothetical protein